MEEDGQETSGEAVNIIEASAVLRISVPFTSNQLLAAYRREAMTRHPDRGGSDDLFRELTTAYDFMRPLASSATVEGERTTSDGTPLSELGKGFPLTKSARTCDHCEGAGYNSDEQHSGASIECPKCCGHGVISYPCRRCNGKGETNGTKCRTCNGSGRFFPRVTEKEIKDGVSFQNSSYMKERAVTVQASAKLPHVHGKICFECEGTGRIDYEENIFTRFWDLDSRLRMKSKMSGISYVQRMVRETGCTLKEAHEKLGFSALTIRATYHRCSVCKGIGEVEMWNPVLPRGLLSIGR